MDPPPTFVLVPGVYHTPVHAQLLVKSLRAKGFPTHAISHPSIGPLAATAAPNADVENLRQVLEELVTDQEKDVILVCHSYGGIPGTQSLNGLERSARAKTGKRGGILRVIYLSAILACEGESLLDTLVGAGMGPGEWMDLDPATGTFKVNSKALTTLYHDLPLDEAEHWVAKLEPMSASMGSTPVRNVSWDTDIPKVYIFCKKDRVFTLEGQQKMLERVKGSKRGGWETYEMDCGHSPFLSHVEDLTDILTKM